MSLEETPAADLRTEADRRADAHAFAINAARAAGVAVYLGLSFWAALTLTKGDPAEPVRSLLIWGPVASSAIIAGLVAGMIQKMDERERSLAYRSLAYAGFALAGMMMGASASNLTDPEPSGDGVIAVTYIALPSLLAFAMLMPPVLRFFLRKKGC